MFSGTSITTQHHPYKIPGKVGVARFLSIENFTLNFWLVSVHGILNA
jgi:hypothetical protein